MFLALFASIPRPTCSALPPSGLFLQALPNIDRRLIHARA
jgi:hypothetical protein